ncbi:MAG: hypothetical protein ACYSWP_17070 [Planctomycetota bacterium]
MQSKITKPATAAIILIAVLIGINQFGGPINVTGVALANVAKEIEQIKNCVFKKTTTVSSKDNETNTFDSLAYHAEGVIREDLYDNNKIAKQVYVKASEGIIVGIDHKLKLFKKMDMTDEDIELFAPVGPNNFVNRILQKGKYKKLGQKTVDGVLSEGFEFNDKRTMLSLVAF